MAACIHFYEKHAAILCLLKIVYLFLVPASNFNLATTNLARSSSRPSLPLSRSSSRANCLFRVATWFSRPLFSAQNSPKSELHVWMVNFEWARKVCRQCHAHFFLLFLQKAEFGENSWPVFKISICSWWRRSCCGLACGVEVEADSLSCAMSFSKMRIILSFSLLSVVARWSFA